MINHIWKVHSIINDHSIPSLLPPLPFLNSSVLKTLHEAKLDITTRVGGRASVAQSWLPINKWRHTVPRSWSSNAIRKMPAWERGGAKRRLITGKGTDEVGKYIKQNGSQVSHHQKRQVQEKRRQLEWTQGCCVPDFCSLIGHGNSNS